MNNDIKFKLEELVDEARELSGLAVTLKLAMEGPSESDYFEGAASILATQMVEHSKRMESLFARIE